MARSRPPRTHRYSMQFKATAVRLSELRDVRVHEKATWKPNLLGRKIWRESGRKQPHSAS